MVAAAKRPSKAVAKSVAKSVATDVDATDVDATDVDATDVDATDVDATDSTIATETPTEKTERKMPVSVFEVVEDLPTNPTANVGEGFGTSKWVGTTKRVLDNAPEDTWVKVMNYRGVNGGRLAQKGLEDKVAEGKSPFPELDEGKAFYTDVRRFDVVDDDGSKSRQSALYIGYGAVDGSLVEKSKATGGTPVLMLLSGVGEVQEGDEVDVDTDVAE